MPRMHLETPIISRFPTLHMPNGDARHTIFGYLTIEFQAKDKDLCDQVARICLAALEANGKIPAPTPIPDAILQAAIADPPERIEEAN